MRCLLITAAFVMAFALPAAAQEIASITVVDVGAQVDFGRRVRFTLELRTETTINAITFSLQEGGALDVLDLPVTVEPGDPVRASAELDLSRYTLTPFARAFYWWRVEDAAGNVLNIDPTLFQYDDSRFAWETSSRDNINVHAYGWTPAQRQAMLDEALTAQARIMARLQSMAPAVIDIYAYYTLDELRTALSLHGRDAIEGYADPRHNVVLISPSRAYFDLDLRRQIPHELAHITIGHLAGEGIVPAWLVEGLAVLFEAEPDPDLRAVFEANAEAGTLLPLDTLCAAFPLDRNASALAYAQSHELVRYIESRYGPAGIRRLLDAYAQGASCEGGTAQGLGVSLSTLERDWLLAAGEREALPPPSSLLVWVLLLVIFIGWPAVFLTARRSERRQFHKSSSSLS